MTEYTSQVIESRLDWVTLTCTSDDKRDHFWNFGLMLAELAGKDGLPMRRWNWKGYDGQHAQGVTVGRRKDSDILQLSGPLADEWFDLAWQHADNCTRIDLCVTVKVEEEVSGIIGSHEEECCAWKREKPRTLSVGLIKNDGRPSTLYLGQRVSDLFARIYDKHLESAKPDYEQCVRYELEVKGTPAERCAAWLCSTGDRASGIRDAVHKHCVQRGLSPRFSSMGGDVCLKTIRPTSDIDSRLAWLAQSVRPVVERLLAADKGEEIVVALGLRRSVMEMVRLRGQLEWGNHRSELWDEVGDVDA